MTGMLKSLRLLVALLATLLLTILAPLLAQEVNGRDERIDQSIRRGLAYLSRGQIETGTFGYQDTNSNAEKLTGAGLLCLELCGRHGHPATRRAGKYLADNFHKLQTVQRRLYGMYYTAQGLFQIGGEPWKDFAEWMYDYWIPRQAPDGHWDEGEDGCPYYQTALVVLAFTVPYRQLPIYQRDETVDEVD